MDSKMKKELTKQLSVARQTSVDMARRHTQDLKTAKEAVALATDVARVAKAEHTRLDKIFARGQSQSRNYMKKGKLKKGKYIRGDTKDMRFPGAVDQEREAKAQWYIWQDAKDVRERAKVDLRRLNEKSSSSSRSARPDDVSTGMTEAEGADLLKNLVADTRGPRHQTFWPRGATRKKKTRRSKRRSTKRRRRSRRSRKGSTKHRRHSRKRSTKHRRHSRKRSTKRRRRSRRSRHSHRRRS